jgi:hypothetical protein
MSQTYLAALRAALEGQDEEFRAFERCLTALGDGELAVPCEMLEDFDAVTTACNPPLPVDGIRG